MIYLGHIKCMNEVVTLGLCWTLVLAIAGGLTQVYEVRCNSFIFLNTHIHYAATETKALPECKLVVYSFILDHYFK